jgi:hypothetical protein
MILAFVIMVAWNPAIATMDRIRIDMASAYTFTSPGANAASGEVWDILRGAGTVMLYGFLLVVLMWAYLRFQRKERVTGAYV